MAVMAPASAEARVPHLSKGEAARVIGSYLKKDFKYGAKPGSMDGVCFRKARNRVRCNIIFADRDGRCWEGDVWVRELRRGYRIGTDLNICDGTHD